MGTTNNTNQKQKVNSATINPGVFTPRQAKGVSKDELEKALAAAQEELVQLKEENKELRQGLARQLPIPNPNQEISDTSE